jgi:hypothetical protein
LRTHRESHLNHLIERWLVARRTQQTIIFFTVKSPQRGAGVEDPAASGAQHVPRQFEQTKTGGVKERGDSLLFIETALGGEIEHVYAAQFAIACLAHRMLNGSGTVRVSGLAQHAK